MGAMEEYLEELRRHLWCISRSARENILQEIRSHILDSASNIGEINERTIETVIGQLQDPKEVARNHLEVYGYSGLIQTIFVFGCALVALFTLPYNPMIPASSSLSVLLLSLLVAMLIAISLKGGKWVGILSGTAAAISRVVGFSVLYQLYAEEAVPIGEEVPVYAGLVVVSLLLILIGYFPGRVKEKWFVEGIG